MSSNFNGIAPFYDALAFVVFGRALQRAQLAWLNQIPAGASVLLVGGGTGWLLEQVLTHCQPKRVVYLEASSQMLTLTSRRMLRRSVIGSVDFRRGDIRNLTVTGQFDVILTPFVLDLFTETTLRMVVIPTLQQNLKPGGLWLATDFVQTTIWWQKTLLWMMIRFFRLTTDIETQRLSDWQQCLIEAGMIRTEQNFWLNGMVTSEVWKG